MKVLAAGCLLSSAVFAEEVQQKASCDVRILTYVGSDTMDAFLTKIADPEVCAEDQRVRLTIQSGGGEVDAGMFAYSLLRKRTGGVDTHVQYSAASMAIILLLAGETRTMSPDAHLLVHEVTQYIEGDYEPDKLKEFVDGLDISHRDYVAIVVERTGLSKEEVETLMADHTYLTATEALKLGFVTAITN